jgi:D-alanyl-D-alanine carboxypeptidase
MSIRHISRRSTLFRGITVVAVASLTLALFTAGSSATQPDPAVPAFGRDLRPLLEARMRQTATPGAVVYVNVPGKGTWLTALGTANLSNRAPMSTALSTRIGSVTKTFTAETILRLVDQGKIGLDDPVSKYRPEVLKVAGGGAEHITIRQLLNMSSGFFDYQEDGDFLKLGSDRPDSVFDPPYLISVAMKHRLYFTPGTSFHYSNTNTVLLGLIIQQVAGQTVADAYEQQLFGPLGMSHTSFPDRSSSAIPEPHARGYYYATDEQYSARGLPTDETTWNPSWGWTAGAAISTVHDLAAWAPALGTGRLLSRATFAQQTKFIAIPGSTARYGLGMFDFEGYYGHNGSLPGYTTFVAFQPRQHRTIVVITNLTTPGQSPADQLAAIIIKETAGL